MKDYFKELVTRYREYRSLHIHNLGASRAISKIQEKQIVSALIDYSNVRSSND